jgi:hypothetical protein
MWALVVALVASLTRNAQLLKITPEENAAARHQSTLSLFLPWATMLFCGNR